MSTPNPLAPQGSLLEQQGRGRSTLQIITFIGALHVFFLCGLLWIGCKKDDRPQSGLDPLANPGSLSGVVDSNAIPSNPVPAPITPAPITPAPIPNTLITPAPTTVVPPAPGPIVPAPLAPAVVEPTPAPATAASEYKVQKGDTGVVIAHKHGISLAALKAANPTAKWNALKINESLHIPASDSRSASGGSPAPAPTLGSSPGAPTTAPADGTAYEVKPGDTGAKIARKFGVSWKSIRHANHLTSDVIKPKQKLTIPGKSGGGATPSGGTPAETTPVITPTAIPIVAPPTGSYPVPTPGRP